jgi:hypothetical protein
LDHYEKREKNPRILKITKEEEAIKKDRKDT